MPFWLRTATPTMFVPSLRTSKSWSRILDFVARVTWKLEITHKEKAIAMIGLWIVNETRWDEKAGLRRDAVRSQVIDAL
jgi:hypothetical protein